MLFLAVKVICDRVTGQSRGYGFVKFASEAAAGEAIKEMDGLVCRTSKDIDMLKYRLVMNCYVSL